MFDGMKFLELWINYVVLKWSFFETKFETAMNIVETVLNEFESEVKEAIQIPPQQMTFILNSANISINKYWMLVTAVQQHLSRTEFKTLNCFPKVKDVKNEIQKLEQKITNLFELNKDCSKEQKNQRVACCQLVVVIDWICCCLVGVDQCGSAAT